MAIALVSHVALANASGLSTAAIDTTGASLLVACFSDYTGQSPGVLSDSKGNTWVPLATQSSPSVRLRLFYAANPTVGAGHTFAADSTNSFVGLAVAAFSGVAAASPLDLSSGANSGGASATSLQPGSITPTQAGEVVVLAVGVNEAAAQVAVDSGFTITDDVSFAAAFIEAALAYLIQTSAAAVNPTASLPPSGSPMAATQASFKAAAVGSLQPYFEVSEVVWL